MEGQLISFLGNNDRIFGLDIGFETLKLCEVSKATSKGVEIWGMCEYPITEPILDRDRIKDKSATANLIKEACRKATPHSIKAKKIVTALPETFVFSKTIQVPKMNQHEMNTAVPNEAAQYLPIPINEVYIDYQILSTHPDEALMDVLVAASPKKLVDDYVEMAKMAGMELVALETKPIATGRAVIKDKNFSVAVVHIGTELTRIAIWDKGNIRLVTTASIGKNQIIEKISAIRPGFKNISEINISEDKTPLGMVFDEIIDEVFDAIRYYQNRSYKPSPIKLIEICGSAAKIKGVEDHFSEITKIKTQVSSPLFTNRKSIDPQFIPALGLALRKN